MQIGAEVQSAGHLSGSSVPNLSHDMCMRFSLELNFWFWSLFLSSGPSTPPSLLGVSAGLLAR